ncbi:MAG: DUF4290 domain-containing protein [Bacteroidia bacterium]
MKNEDIAEGLEYNTQRPQLKIPEYGRNIQKMIGYALKVKDKDERNTVAKAIVNVMGQVNPSLKEIEDLTHKLWTHLFLISDFELDVDSPYEKPSPEIFLEKPEILDYPKNKIRYGHYGVAIQNMIKVISEFKEGEEKEHLVRLMVNLMKRMYLTWNRDSVDDELILNQLDELSGGKLKLSEHLNITSTSEILRANINTNTVIKKKNKNFKHKNKKRF